MEDSIMAKISEVLGSISRTNPIYVEYNTNGVTKCISAPGKNVWFDLPDITIIIPEDGVYLLNANVRMWQSTTSDSKWKGHRILFNGNEDRNLKWFVINPQDVKFNLDSTSSFSYIYKFNKGDVLQIQGFIAYNQSGNVYYSDANGSSLISAYKIGE
jgi:hypothetical protein